MADEDLTEQQVHKLLKDAEARLRVANSNSNDKINPNNLVKSLQHNISTLAAATPIESYVNGFHTIPNVNAKHILPKITKIQSDDIRIVVDPVLMKKNLDQENKATAGTDWFNLPRTRLTPELKRDLQLLRMRDVLDPKRHYKKDNMRNKIPEFSQVGTIIEGPTEYFSGRLTNKERKKTLVEETLDHEKVTGRFKKKYNEIQSKKTSGKKAYYKNLRGMRVKGGIFKS
ncbi:rRNA-processing protein fcf2 [Erysiphe neolycopersici]|uniref:rRNA-processing protein fcf2 n=1 Tax=Erysiphe neolycopersici TaxID=212602 RepID=A0A420HZQ1_9PEZI|nr:rRNA-processing protein fcf2 [Erysiphe neolycopersici]